MGTSLVPRTGSPWEVKKTENEKTNSGDLVLNSSDGPVVTPTKPTETLGKSPDIRGSVVSAAMKSMLKFIFYNVGAYISWMFTLQQSSRI